MGDLQNDNQQEQNIRENKVEIHAQPVNVNKEENINADKQQNINIQEQQNVNVQINAENVQKQDGQKEEENKDQEQLALNEVVEKVNGNMPEAVPENAVVPAKKETEKESDNNDFVTIDKQDYENELKKEVGDSFVVLTDEEKSELIGEMNAEKAEKKDYTAKNNPAGQLDQIYNNIWDSQDDISLTDHMNDSIGRNKLKAQLSRQIRIAHTMQSKKNGGGALYDLDNTAKDVEEIQSILKSLEKGHFQIKEKALAKAKLKSLLGRDQAHLMLNDTKFTGDSSEMDKVKTAVANLENALTKYSDKPITEKEIDSISAYYNMAMEECRKYCDTKNPWTAAGKRRKFIVQATLKRITEEAEQFELGRAILLKEGPEAVSVNSGMELLSYAAFNEFFLRQKDTEEKNAENKLLTNLEIEIEAREEKYKEGYADYLKKKEGESFFSFFTGSEADALLEKLEEYKSDTEKLSKEKEKLKGARLERIKQKKLDEKNEYLKEKEKAFDDIVENSRDLSDSMKTIARLLHSGEAPSSLIKDKKKVTSEEIKLLSEFAEIRKALVNFKEGKTAAATARIQGKFVRFVQNGSGLMFMQVGKTRVPLVYRGDQLSDVIADDIIHNRNLYGDKEAKEVIRVQRTVLEDMTGGELLRARQFCAQVLYDITKVPMNLMNNISNIALKNYAMKALTSGVNVEKLTKEFKDYVNAQNEAQKEKNINTVLNFELQSVGRKLSDGVVMNVQEKEDDSGWSEEERKLRDLAADIVFSRDTWVADGLKKDPGERIKKVLLDHHEALAILISDQFRDKQKKPEGIIESMIDKLPLFGMGEGDVDALKAEITKALETVRTMIEEKAEEMAEDSGLGGFGKLLAKGVASAKFSDVKEADKIVMNLLENTDEEHMKKFVEVDAEINKAVTKVMDGIQKAFDSCVDSLFGSEEKEEEKKPLQIDGIIQKKKTVTVMRDKFAKEQKKTDKLQKEFDEQVKQISELKEEINVIKNNAAELAEKKDEILFDDDYKEIVRKNNDDLAELNTELNDLIKKNRATEKNLDKAKKDLKVSRKDAEKEAKNERMDEIRSRMLQRENEIKKGEETLILLKEKLEAKKKEEEQLDAQTDELKKEVVPLATEMQKLDNKIRTEYGEDKELTKEQKLEKLDLIQKREELKEKIDKMNEPVVEMAGKVVAMAGVLRDLEEDVEKQKKELVKMKENQAKYLEKALEEAAKGKKGQGLFMKNVFRIYFKSMPVMDQRSMIASAFRNSKPIPVMSAEQKNNMSREEGIDLSASMLGGMFKGAGPLFQKMLQGMPLNDEMPKGLRKAIEDTQDNLAHMPEEVVKAHMESIIGRSEGKIDKIVVDRSLGAASVGQAFLCTLYGPAMRDGKKVVIKLLRPDARNRMMREKQVMLKAARMTDEEGKLPFEIEEMRRKNQIGGMEATYLGNLQRIEEELDLTKEAKNCREGEVYDKPLIDEETKQEKPNLVNSMKLSNLAAPTSDTCVMEIAGEKTLKAYMNEVKEKNERLLEKFCVKEKELDKDGKETGRMVLKKNENGSFVIRENLTSEEKIELVAVKDELSKLTTELDIKQKAMAQLAEKWVTEGIFEEGYYHGDLHGGNIMINKNGVTVIDFGNATRLSKKHQEHITKMMIAACMGEVEDFRHSFHALLENTPEEVYQEKREELTLAFKEIFSIGDEGDAAMRIAVALSKAQEIGLELPPTIANFSSCQMRLQNALNDVNETMKGIKSNINQIAQAGEFDFVITKADPVTSAIDKSQLVTDKEAVKEHIRICRRAIEVAKEDEFKSILREGSEKLYNEFGISDSSEREKEFDRMEAIVKGARPTSIDKINAKLLNLDNEESINATFKNIFPNLFEYRESLKDDIEKGFIRNVFIAYCELINTRRTEDQEAKAKQEKNYVPDITVTYKSLEDFAHNAGTNAKPGIAEMVSKYSMDSVKGTGGIERLVRDYYDEKKKQVPEAEQEKQARDTKLADLENRIYAEYVKDAKPKVGGRINTFMMELDKFIPPVFAGVEEAEKSLKIMDYDHCPGMIETVINSSISNSVNGKELKEEGDKLVEMVRVCAKGPDKTEEDCMEKYRERYKEMKVQYNKVKELLKVGQVETLRELEQKVQGHTIDNTSSKRQSFFDVMSDVMIKYQKRVMWRIGVKGMMKLNKASNESNNKKDKED